MFKKEGKPLNIRGNKIKCTACGNDHFWHRKAQLNTSILTFFKLDWLNKEAECFICDQCGYIHWFLSK